MLCGRAHARVPRIGASVTAGNERARPGEDPLDPVRRFRFARQERRPDRGDPVERHQAEMDAGFVVGHPGRPGADRRADLGLLQDVGRAGRQLGLDDDAPARPDRQPPPGRVDDGRRSRPRRHQDRVRRCRHAIHHDPDDRLAAPVEGGRPAGAHPDAASLGDRRVGVGRGGRRDRVADPDQAAPDAGRDRRFDRLELGAAGHDALQLGERIGQRPVDGADGGLVRGHVDEARRLRAETKPDIGRGQLAVQADRLAVERREDRVERVLDDAGVRPRCPGRQTVALDQRDGRSGLGEERRRGRPDDPATDDDDVRSGGRHPAEVRGTTPMIRRRPTATAAARTDRSGRPARGSPGSRRAFSVASPAQAGRPTRPRQGPPAGPSGRRRPAVDRRARSRRGLPTGRAAWSLR